MMDDVGRGPISHVLDRLREGNLRFARGARPSGANADPARLAELLTGQDPIAVVLGCSDSRVPVETVFDQGPGDLFVIRVAGNIVTPSQMGSVEFAATYLGTRLVVVLGHTRCGAVDAAVHAVQGPGAKLSTGLESIVDAVAPSVRTILSEQPTIEPDALVQRAMRANVRKSAEELRRGSEVLRPLIANGELRVVGAEYALETGVVDFFDERPDLAGSAPPRDRDPEEA